MSNLIPFALNSPQAYSVTGRFIAWLCVAQMFTFLINNYLIFWQNWPGVTNLISGQANNISLATLQLISYLIAAIIPAIYVQKTHNKSTINDYKILIQISQYIIKTAFWAVLIIGVIDALIAMLHSETLLHSVFGEIIGNKLGRSAFRGPYIHMPLIIIAAIIAAKTKSLGFHWLALLVVIAEFSIVITRFIFSYEQPFMGDLVRFWYAALFLFASAYTLWHEGHVRVDVFYSKFSTKQKATVNIFGCILLGIPICWVILARGMWEKTHIINAPLLNFEVSQSGFGMYVKYLMAGFLIIYATTMMCHFCAYMLKNIALVTGDEKALVTGDEKINVTGDEKINVTGDEKPSKSQTEITEI